MRHLLVVGLLALLAPHAHAGEFVARETKIAPAAAVGKPRAKPVNRRTWQAKAQPKKPKKKHLAEKRPMP